MSFGRLRALALALLLAASAAPLSAQAGSPQGELEAFVARVGTLWESEDASALADLAPGGQRLLLHLGDGRGREVGRRHAAAALRELFSERESVNIRAVRVTVSGGDPLQGFGELSWVSRPRGVTRPERSTVYVGAIREGGSWKVRELRLLP